MLIDERKHPPRLEWTMDDLPPLPTLPTMPIAPANVGIMMRAYAAAAVAMERERRHDTLMEIVGGMRTRAVNNVMVKATTLEMFADEIAAAIRGVQ